MARTIMAVCVVCLLCAHRVPCQQHFESTIYASSVVNSSAALLDAEIHNSINDSRSSKYLSGTMPLNAKVFQSNAATNHPSSNNFENMSKHRHKRHGDHGAPAKHHRPQLTEEYIQRIFKEYGEDGTINMHSFRRILGQLGLYQMIPFNETNESTSKANSKEIEGGTLDNDSCIVDLQIIQHIKPYDLSHSHNHNHADSQHQSDNSTAEHTYLDYTISQEDLFNVCPVLLYQLSRIAVANNSCIPSSILAEMDSMEAFEEKEDILYVWMYAFSTVFACSLLGLVGVAIIPFMDSRFYKHILQFLVSLAVGTMTGDALLHLLPHAVAGQNEENMIYKGLTCMGGIIFFYITEHGLTMIAEWRKRIAKAEPKGSTGAKIVRDPDSSINNSVAGDKLCKSKYSSYPYCYDEIAMDSKNDVWMHLPQNSNNISSEDTLPQCSERKRNGKMEVDAGGTAGQSLLSTSHNNYAPIAEMNHHSHHHIHNHVDQINTTELDSNAMDGVVVSNLSAGPTAIVNGNNKEKEPVTVILREHESSHHGHSHKHGHVHSPPESLSAVVWMIIMGDGLHNFTDGMAIGAAFADNTAGGFSTSLAVFCHELPHELGDFAILIKAGMSVKTAVYYNLLTGVLSFIGMIFGIVFGQSQEAAQWMFAAAAGLFIYIALVDMMPEMSSTHKSLEHFALQILGMCSGVLLMLLIAIYEGDLMTIFSSTIVGDMAHQH